MHRKSMLSFVCLWAVFAVNAQEDSTSIQLEKIEIKGVSAQESVYKKEKIDVLQREISAGNDLAKQIEVLPGVNVRKSGTNITKPVIDGLSSSRLIYMMNGVRLENQDWADAHSPEIDADLAGNLSIIRGAETVKYGANALGGVVFAEQEKIPNDTLLNGKAGMNYRSNTRGWGGFIRLQQKLKAIPNLKWKLATNVIQNGDYQTAEYNVTNSGTRLNSLHGELLYEGKKLNAEVFYNDYSAKQGNYFGALTGNIEEFEERIKNGRPLAVFPYEFAINYPLQETRHQIASGKIQWKFNRRWKWNLGYNYQQNHRREYDLRRANSNSVPVQDMILTTQNWNSSLQFNHYRFNSTLGFQIRDKENLNQPGTGVTPALPNYIFKEASVFTYHDIKLSPFKFNVGLRYDKAKMNALGIDFLGNSYGDKKDYSAFSSQLAVDLDVDEWHFNSSVSYGWRIPESYELFANGKEHGIPIFYVGDKDLRPEKATKWVNHIHYHNSWFDTQISGFVHWFEDYIYGVPTHQYKQLFAGPAAIFQFKQQAALIYGLDLIQDWNVTENFQIKNQISWIEGKEIHSKNYLPNISPLKVQNQIRFQAKDWGKFNTNTIQISHLWKAKKTNYNPDYELSNQTPDAYHLFDFALHTNYKINEKFNTDITFGAENIFNLLYKDYLNLHRYFVHDNGRNIFINLKFNF
ncbi:putative TonB-dependent receptor NMB0964 [Candidatus Ornithobacterium hominis]|uniref:TonB-dependent receptor n=1 Tax=Candidatus Ornithobacterium hominis TaxID=2497989 RepID=UPI0024BD57E6|nr:TonB-dependent receptor plug domain-containing protein [Candidatus Ornithobacterium hominis]CAI9429975.1 putative TonB-dependent receptor NMB0964 [Candidatus Ornithobacterium hominis]